MTVDVGSLTAAADAPGPKSILAVLVLYKVAAEASPAYTSLQRSLSVDDASAASIEIVIFDNSPYEQVVPEGFAGRYLRDTSNPGLARCYNRSLIIAEEREIPWLMLLDQDTTVTAEYLCEVLAETKQLGEMRDDAVTRKIVALVPKLVEGGRVQSPHGRPTFKHTALDRMIHGVSEITLYAFNSGAVVRVEALRDVGGFPEDFWLDFLDHATFHLLQSGGGKLFVLQSCLSHELSSNNRVSKPAISPERYQNVLDAERIFYQRHGTAADRVYLKIRLLRIFARTLLLHRQLRPALQVLIALAKF